MARHSDVIICRNADLPLGGSAPHAPYPVKIWDKMAAMHAWAGNLQGFSPNLGFTLYQLSKKQTPTLSPFALLSTCHL